MASAANSALALEAQIIGAVLSTPSLFARAAFLQTDSFSDPTFAAIWKSIETAALEGKKITPAALAMRDSAKLDPLGGLEYLNRLAAHGEAIITCFTEALDRLHEESQWRRIATIAARLQAAEDTREKSPDAILSGLSDLARTQLSGGRASTRTKREVARAAIDTARETRPTLTTGMDSLDYLMQGGIQPRRLYGLGGLFGRGKTIMLGTISDNINLQGTPHLFLSLEASPEDIETRSCARHLELNASAIFDTGDRDHARFLKSADRYVDAVPDNTFYEYTPQATIDEIHRKILAAKSRHGIHGFILDYWQLIKGRERGQSEDAHLRDCADRLAAICRQEDLWGLVTAQVDQRGALRISDSLYQSASLYVRLCREENDSAAYFITEKSNFTPYADTGSESVPGMIFDQAVGPHFRNTGAADIGELNREGDIDV